MEHLFDTHFHLDLQQDRVSTVREIQERQIYTIAVTNLPDLYKKGIAEVSSKFVQVALGFHPELVHEYHNQIPKMWEMLPAARYVGEVGLDFTNRNYQSEQTAFFGELVERCRFDCKKIMTIHSRKSVKEVLDILGNNYRFKAILHWFSGNKRELITAVENGCYFSVNSAMTKTKKFIELLPFIPSNRILLETDNPFIISDKSQSESLQSVKNAIKRYRPEVDLWENFKGLLNE